MFDAFRREAERIDGADMITRGSIQGTKPIQARAMALRNQVMLGPVTSETREEMSQRADELFAHHAAAMKRIPVS